jgi:hypothetical protein
MIAGLTLAAAGTALLATAGTATPLALIILGSLLIGLISLAMPAMVAAVVGAARPEHAGVVATAGYLAAIVLAWTTIRRGRERRAPR